MIFSIRYDIRVGSGGYQRCLRCQICRILAARGCSRDAWMHVILHDKMSCSCCNLLQKVLYYMQDILLQPVQACRSLNCNLTLLRISYPLLPGLKYHSGSTDRYMTGFLTRFGQSNSYRTTLMWVSCEAQADQVLIIAGADISQGRSYDTNRSDQPQQSLAAFDPRLT
jgi:hypothetical protein